MACIRGGWEGARGGGKPKAGYTFYYDTVSIAVSLVRDRNRHNPQDRQIARQIARLSWLLAAIWHHPHPY